MSEVVFRCLPCRVTWTAPEDRPGCPLCAMAGERQPEPPAPRRPEHVPDPEYLRRVAGGCCG